MVCITPSVAAPMEIVSDLPSIRPGQARVIGCCWVSADGGLTRFACATICTGVILTRNIASASPARQAISRIKFLFIASGSCHPLRGHLPTPQCGEQTAPNGGHVKQLLPYAHLARRDHAKLHRFGGPTVNRAMRWAHPPAKFWVCTIVLGRWQSSAFLLHLELLV